MSIATKTYIRSVEIENFMCHTRFLVELNPNLNVIIGKNGSGKSTILTALTVGLGGLASSTARASKVVDLIKEGAHAAYVTVTLNVPAASTYYETYGDSIIIVRRISKTGSTLALKSSDKKTQSTRMRDLAVILSNYGIFPSNPLLMLNQERAKEFLSATSPKVLFDKISEALLVSNMHQHLESMSARLEKWQKDLEATKAEILKEESKTVHLEKSLQLLKELSRADETIAELTSVLKWRRLQTDMDAIQDLEADIQDLMKRIDDAKGLDRQQAFTDIDTETVAINEKLTSIETRKAQVEDEIETSNKAAQTLQRTLNELQGSITKYRQEVKYTDAEIARVQESVRRNDSAVVDQEMARLQTQLETSEKTISDIDTQIIELKERQSTKAEEALEIESNEAAPLARKVTDINAQITARSRELQTLSSGSTRNPYADYSPRLALERVMREIATESRWQQRPIGPLGVYIKITDAKWQPYIERQLNRQLDSFWVVTEHDRKLLQIILQKCRSSASIVLRQNEQFDYTRSLPPLSSRYQRVIDLLRFKDESIKCMLIDVARFEQDLVVDNLREAMALTSSENKHPNVRFAIVCGDRGRPGSLLGSTVRGVDESRRIAPWKTPFRLLVENQSEKERLQQAISQFREELDATNQQLHQVKDRIKTLRNEQLRMDEEIFQLEKKRHKSRNLLQQTREKMDGLPDLEVDYTEELERLKTKRQNLLDQVDHMESQLPLRRANHQQKQEEAETLREYLAKSNEEAADCIKSLNDIETRRNSLTTQRQDLRREIKSLETDKKDKLEELEPIKAKVAQVEAELGERRNLANYPATAEIQKQISKLKAQRGVISEGGEDLAQKIRQIEEEILEHERSRHNKEQATKVVEETRAKYKKGFKRRQRYSDRTVEYYYKKIASNFAEFLSRRRFQGNLIINEEAKTVEMRVSPASDGHSDTLRKTVSLSGGEQSYTQLVLLLSVWEALTVGLVAMDEYDVFMDKANRRHAFSLLISSILRHDIQGILITPQDIEADLLQNEEFASKIKLHRLDDPDRPS